MKALRLAAVFFALIFAFTGLTVVAGAQDSAFFVRGNVRDAAGGNAVEGASITLVRSNGDAAGSARSNRAGVFAVRLPEAGTYRLAVTATGYAPVSLDVSVGSAPVADVAILLARTAAPSEIGHITAHASDAATAPLRRVPQGALAGEGSLRVADALGKLPGISTSGDAAATGGDAYVSLRGLRPGESQTLLDGHPIGPLGVAVSPPDADGTVAGFNFQDAPYFALRDVDVNSVADDAHVAGEDAIGGTIDLHTLDPTQRAELALEQSIGTQGRTSTSLRATGSIGKLGYAFVHGVEGTYGAFPGEPIAQTGLRGTDLTSASLAGFTYRVSGDYVLRNELAKLVYAPMPGTSIALTAYDATSWADKTGEGDNDFNPYAYALANAPVGATPACPHGVAVSTNAGPECISAAAYAAAASGPAGGGPGAFQALRTPDYDLRVASILGKNALALDAFDGTYALEYHRAGSLASGPLDAFLDRWSTQGVRVSDALDGTKNAFGFGISWLRQTLDGNATTPDGSAFVATTPASRFDRSAFVRDIFSPDVHLSVEAGATVKRSSLDAASHFDPRFSVEYRPSVRDAFRATAARASEEPSLQTDRVNLLPVGALNPDCGAIAQATATTPVAVNVGSGPAANLSAEASTDLELGYQHRFAEASTIGATLYDANVTDRIVTGDFAAGSALSASSLGPLAARIAQFCGVTPTPGSVTYTLSRSFNAATARIRGIEFAGKTSLGSRFGIDYAYDVQSIVLDDLPPAVLATDPTLVNGTQAFEVPLHKASLGIDFTNGTGLDIRIDGHAVGINNPQQLPGYAYADASLSQMLTRHANVTIDVSNMFDSHAQSYGLVGYGVPYATNPYNATLGAPFVQPFNERYGLAPMSVTVSATLRM